MNLYVAKKEAKQKKKSKTWVWWVGLGTIGGLWYYNKRKKEKEQALALAAQTQATQLKATQLAQQETKTNPQNESLLGNSTESRLRAMGETYKGHNPTARQEWRDF